MKLFNKKFVPPISPLMVAGVLVVLLPIFAFMTLDRMEKQKDHIKERFLVTGTSLIRTFEAGTRTGMLSMGWGKQRVQAMLMETAVQPDIAYIMITDGKGRILAHSDPDLTGTMVEVLPDISRVKEQMHKVFSRKRQKEGQPIFEVYKRFTPLTKGFQGRHPSMHGMSGDNNSHGFGKEWKKSMGHQSFSDMSDQYIFAGLSMSRAVHDQDMMARSTIGRGILFFIIGCTGVICLFAFQAYRSAKASLNRVKAFSDTVVQNMPSGLITIALDFYVTSMNRAAEEILGQAPTRAYPQMIQLASEMSVSKDVVSQEVTLRPSTPSELRLDMTASPILDDDCLVQGFIFLFRDLTQLKELKKEVETNRRLAAIGKLAGGVAHEIRNPLSSIKGFATYFGKRYEQNPDDAETARIMVQEVERINRSITQLLEFAKPMAVEEKNIDIQPLIRHSLKLVAHDLERKNIASTVDIQTSCKTFRSDPDRINQVLLNLYMNALNAMENNAMDDNGRLGVEVVDRTGGTTGETGIEIRVKDNGCGIDKKTLDDIFDPYFTTRPDGTGLGLSIVYRIVENLGGEIRVESELGKGSCFIVSLPGKALITEKESKGKI